MASPVMTMTCGPILGDDFPDLCRIELRFEDDGVSGEQSVERRHQCRGVDQRWKHAPPHSVRLPRRHRATAGTSSAIGSPE